MKRVLIALFVLSLFVFVSSGVFAVVTPVCTIVDKNSCNDNNEVLKLSDLTNAHGELPTEINYNYALCCDFAGSKECKETNKIISLSSSTNAHAEVPDATSPQYLTDVCYGDLECISTTACDTTYPIEMFSLSETPNAHIGPPSQYSTKICCTSITLVTSAFWSKNGFTRTSFVDVVPEQTQVYTVLKNADLFTNKDVTFKIYEKDTSSDDEIKVTNSKTDEFGSAKEIWTITQDDLDNGQDFFENINSLVFYFKVYDGNTLITTSSDMSISVLESDFCNDKFICENYGEDYCDTDPCAVAQASVPAQINCGDPLVSCFCEFDATQSKCLGTSEITTFDLATNTTSTGKCVIDSDPTSDTNGCGDGFITYSWTATWTGTGTAPSSCVNGQQTLQCPAQIQLPFFGGIHFIITALIISIIYTVMILKQKKKIGKRK